ncbi:MAG: bifunctional phosphopantothenoylcysteine decarboxylase/phosphopantothenate--cysteine ligase CoaBC [Deltaproteobacteria bacterium]|nr:MAG: bifunctional phosphopantothenoylcysteine decarboxylase/phosphopantothenate--cysteine ligase CoaBC [Deltaproteobacteria bacterium]
MRLDGKTVVVGVSGGIACYKACEVVRLLVAAGARVRVVMTAAAQRFVTPLTFQTLAGQPVATDTFDLTQESEIGHIRLADEADAIAIAPATANVIAKLATGLADDLLTTVLLVARAPVVLAPAMNVHMWEHPTVQENLARLVARGAHVVGPTSGWLACGYEGTGRLAEPDDIVEEILRVLAPQDLAGERVLVSAGPTQEAIDPVRYLSNRSSGKMGYAIARVARRRGAEVTLVTGPTALRPPAGVQVVSVTTAEEMARAVQAAFASATVVIMGAAVADYRPRRTLDRKLKKAGQPLTLDLEANPDILRRLSTRKGRRLLVGFAAETNDLVSEARRKLADKRLDLIVGNDVTAPGAAFGGDTNAVHLIDAAGQEEALPVLAKEEVAERILDWVAAHRPAAQRRATVTRVR